jgi:GTP-binding protein HflX
VVALVGYTNAGKSTLLNAMTGADVYVQDQLFATLDAVSRRMETAEKTPYLLTDTVGFIRKLPHTLIDAFRSTLEEAGYSDIILHVIDASDPQAEMHRRVVYDTLIDLGITDKPVITVWNKADLVPEDALFRDFGADASVKLSAKTGEGLDEFYSELARILRDSRVYIDTMIPYKNTAVVAEIRKAGQLLSEEYEEEGIHIKAYVPRALAAKRELAD